MQMVIKSSEIDALALNSEMAKKARELEMQHMEELKVLEESDHACVAETGRPPILTDWVDINERFRPSNRSRLVCQETRGRSTSDVEDCVCCDICCDTSMWAFKLQFSLMMTNSHVERDDGVLILLDIHLTCKKRCSFGKVC